MRPLLFEIGVEELPAAACIEAAVQLPALSLEHLGVKPTELFIGPRRLAFPARVPDRTEAEWVKGPPENLRDRAAAGFAKRYGVGVDDLSVRDGFLGLEVAGASDRRGPAGAPGSDRAWPAVHEVDDVGP